MMTEKRSFPRVPASHPVLYVSEVYPRPRVGSTIEISLEGTRVETPYRLIEGERVTICIAIHSQVIRCRGQVILTEWHDGKRPVAEIRFEELSRQDQFALEEYLAHALRQ